MNPEDLDLLHRHLNGELRGAELQDFFAKLQASPELRRELASFAMDDALLSEVILENRHHARLPKRRPVLRKLLPSVSAAALLLLGLVLLLRLPSAPRAGTLLASGSDTVVLRRGQPMALEPGFVLREGDEVRGAATLQVGAGILLTASGTSVTLNEKGAQLDLARGSLRGVLSSRVTTRRGTVKPAKDSLLEVSFYRDRLRVTVEDGSARLADQEIAAGRFALAGPTFQTGLAVSRARIDPAVARAQAFLAGRKADLTRVLRDEKRHGEAPARTYTELALLALPEGDPLVPELMDAMLKREVESTYTAALQAVALARIDPEKYRDRIRTCARFLADRQCLNGQWDYGEAAVPATRRPNGDNSCSAYAALGLRACREAGVEVDREVVARARAWWLQAQNPDGGWGYHEFGKLDLESKPAVSNTSNASYGSTTASGVSSLLALSTLLGEDYSGHVSVQRGIAWLARNHATDRNPLKAPGFSHLHYWLALERLGLGLGTESLGPLGWYASGAEFLLSRQRPDGSWKVEDGQFMGREIGDVLDTCLAVLFLRRVPFSAEERW